MRRMMQAGMVAAMLGLMLGANAQAAKPAIEIVSPWVREVPPVSQNSAAFLTLRNTGKTDDLLERVESPAAADVEMHEMSMDGNLMRMEKLDSLPLPAGTTVEFTPGDRHIMLFGLKAPLKAGQQVPLILHFHRAGVIRINAPVRADTQG